jgi:Tfp pilus assembly protein PilO
MKQTSPASLSIKRIGVDKTNARIVLVTAAAAFLVVFFLVASASLFSQLRYQNRIIKGKKEAVAQLKKNMDSRDSLVASYKTFNSAPVNYIGGSATGSGAQDGNNAKIVLDALPGTYDFPALTASLEKVASDQQVSIKSVTGTDDSVAQDVERSAATNPPVPMPFEIKVGGDYQAVQRLVESFDRSIRPIQVQSMKISGDSKEVSLDITAQTFYQPARTLNMRTKVIK